VEPGCTGQETWRDIGETGRSNISVGRTIRSK
jgi:hypothetical protein